MALIGGNWKGSNQVLDVLYGSALSLRLARL